MLALAGLVGVQRARNVGRLLAAEHRHMVDLRIRGLVARDAVAALAHRDLLVRLFGAPSGGGLLRERRDGGRDQEPCRDCHREMVSHAPVAVSLEPRDYNAILARDFRCASPAPTNTFPPRA